MMQDFFSMSLKNLSKRRLRSGLTLLGILISIATIFVLISVSIGLENAVKEQFRLLGSDKFFIQPRGQLAGPGSGGAVSFSAEDVETVEKVTGVKLVSAWVATSAKFEFDDQIRFVNVVGIDLESSDLFVETGAYEAQLGRILKEGDTFDTMIGSQYIDEDFLGDLVTTKDTILINDAPFRVRGILKTIGNPQDDRLIYIPEDEFRNLFGIRDRIDTIVVQVEDAEDLNDVAERVERRLVRSRGVTDETKDFTILTPEELIESFGVVLSVVTSFLIGVAAISLLVGGIGIANTVYTSVLERTKEIGVMKAIGAENNTILLIFLIESGILGFVGGVLGVALGIGISKGIEYYAVNFLNTTLLQAAIPLYLVFGCLAFAFLAGAVSGLWPAWKATKIQPVKALRYE